ncbi:uncharacterized protein LOC133319248 [Danaus plexippus]|uniref:uncharacterized protein LOC133319248 n=1 Tax=Danaus plexippus TaxID=13037 RepID=UPI002AB029F2|nr:uncharacterized protein LOC133319248 [Danaus plexippus]
MSRCQCLKLSHPKLHGMPLCRARRLTCSREATVSYAIEECNCLPTCNVDLHYGVPEAFDLITNSHNIDSFYDNLDLKRATVIRVIVQKHEKKICERRSYFLWLNLFSQLGGIFNVFLGCSVLTLLEILQLGWRTLMSYYNRKSQ